VFKVFFLGRMFVVVSDPDASRQILMRYPSHPQFANPSFSLQRGARQTLDTLGLINARGPFWRQMRHAWQPTFAPGSLLRYNALMATCAQQLVTLMEGVADSPDGQYVDIHDALNMMTLEVVGTCAYGVNFNALQPKASATGSREYSLVDACIEFFRGSSFANGSRWGMITALVPPFWGPVLRFLAHTFPDPPFTRQLKARDTIIDTSKSLISNWRANSNSSSEAVSNGSQAPAKLSSFLSSLLEVQSKAKTGDKPVTDMALVAQANTFLVAGTETTANTLSFAIYLLSTHPEAEQQLLAEVDAHGDKPVAPDDKFPFADAVVNESMRMYPAAHSTTRELEGPGPHQVGPYKLSEGVACLIHIYSLHHDPDSWPEASKFMPQRFLPQYAAELGPRNPNSFVPFGAGPRMCIGYKFAQQEARMALVSLYKRFTFDLEPGQVPLKTVTGITLSPSALRVRPVRRPVRAATATE